MILYFSGTGNSRYVAEKIADEIRDSIISLNELIKEKKYEEISSEKPLIFVLPTYGWRMPALVENFIKKISFQGNHKAYFILTCGDSTGNAAHYCKLLCQEKNLDFMGMARIIMPENYIALFTAPDEIESKIIIRKSDPHIRFVAEKIKTLEILPIEPVSFIGKVQSGIINPIFNRFIISAKGFYATDSCIHCSKCALVCPMNNITLPEGMPIWGTHCTHCMACICQCPADAIEYKKKTLGKRRYLLPKDLS